MTITFFVLSFFRFQTLLSHECASSERGHSEVIQSATLIVRLNLVVTFGVSTRVFLVSLGIIYYVLVTTIAVKVIIII
jgi:hypothetical protein